MCVCECVCLCDTLTGAQKRNNNFKTFPISDKRACVCVCLPNTNLSYLFSYFSGFPTPPFLLLMVLLKFAFYKALFTRTIFCLAIKLTLHLLRICVFEVQPDLCTTTTLGTLNLRHVNVLLKVVVVQR